MPSIYKQEPERRWTIRDIIDLENQLEWERNPDRRTAILRCLVEAKAPPPEKV